MTKEEMGGIMTKVQMMDQDELSVFIGAASSRFKYLQEKKDFAATMALEIGDLVSFDSKKYGRTVIKIESVSKGRLKGISVGNRSGVKWTVPASMCTKKTPI